ncbi:hypothetical protein GCM10027043_32010 [Ferruginibacter profundus]
MQTKKMSLANIQGKLSRTEMKNIMAGSLSSNYCNDTNYWWCYYEGQSCSTSGGGSICIKCATGWGCAHG